MSKYAFLFLDDGVDYQAAPTPEQQKVYADIFKEEACAADRRALELTENPAERALLAARLA
jgi:hypothetical protein